MISLVIPVYNEVGNVSLLFNKIKEVLSRLNRDFELIFIDDGSTDGTAAELAGLFRQDPQHLRVIQFTRNFEKSAALMAGYQLVQGEVVVTLDGDLQDDPEEIPNFIKKIEEGYDCVVGWKVKRYDPLSKTLPSKLFNFLVGQIAKVKIHDFNCGFKCYTKEAVGELNLYGGLYRFAPAILNFKGFN
jgi:glycosyltransferase involved in cell wall biosynthesis